MYTPYQHDLLVKMARHNFKKRWDPDYVTPYEMIPQWFKGAPPLKGFAKIKAPELAPGLVARCVALYDFSKTSPGVYQHNIAGVVAALLVWEAIFPNSFGLYEPKLGELIMAWDIYAEPVSIELMKEWDGARHPIRNLILSMPVYEPYRAITVPHCMEEFLGRSGAQ